MNKAHYIHNTILFVLLIRSSISYGQSIGLNYIMSEVLIDSIGSKSVKTVQYYDGFGRPDVLVINGLSPSRKCVYSMKEYDNLGRECKSWLPCVGTLNPYDLDEYHYSSQSQNTYGGDQHAFSETTYDALGRPVFTTTPGELWHQYGKGVATEYRTNQPTDHVKKYVMISVANGTFSEQGYYAPATLTCVKTTDEDGHAIEIYKDFMDNVILERRNGGNDTYYVYDKGLLCVVIPPLYQESNNKSELLYKYKYDGHGRCIEKTLPGCTPIKYEYDKCGRLAFMRDGCMPANTYRFYLYDELSRLAVCGLCTKNNNVSLASHPAETSCSSGDKEIMGTGYFISSKYNILSPTIEIVNYYDNYQFLENSSLQNFIGEANLHKHGHDNATSLLTGRLVKTSDGHYLCSALYYDKKGNVVEKCENTLGGGLHNVTTSYSFTGKPVEVIESFSRNGLTKTVAQQNTYDTNTDLLLTQTHTFNNAPTINTATYSYDNLGRIDSIGRNSNKVSIRYSYDVHGWVNNINGQDVIHNKTLFNEQIHYADYPSNKNYNGNIAFVKFVTSDNPMGAGCHYSYEYHYDEMNRLTRASFGCGQIGTDYCSNVDIFNEVMTYDANSNIVSLVRSGIMDNSSYGVIDNLTYSYYGNKLFGVSDQAPSLVSESAFDFKDNALSTYGAPEYGYNKNGAQTYDANKGITKIDYDLAGNPIRVQFADHSVTENVYSVDGRKLKTVHRTSVPRSDKLEISQTATLSRSETLSVDSTEHIGSFLCINGNPKQYLYDGGYLILGTTTSAPRCYIKDHLGSNRMVVDGTGKIYQNTKYYALGGPTAHSIDQGYQQFKYNGKEYDPMHGLNEYDYGTRQYDPAVGRLTSMDPLCEKYYHISPYAYCKGNPVRFIDPNGERPKAFEAALMAVYVYKDKDDDKEMKQIIAQLGQCGWIKSKFPTSIQFDYTRFDQNGLQSILFERTVNGITEYAYVYAGTNSVEDAVEDIAQLAGAAPQYHTAISNARTLSREVGNCELTFVGHSLGGGEAIASSMATGRAAITFNPAAVSGLTKYIEGLDKTPDVVNYRAVGSKIGIGNIRVGGDVLNNLQEKVGLSLPGKTIGVPTGLMPTHTIYDFLKYKLPEL